MTRGRGEEVICFSFFFFLLFAFCFNPPETLYAHHTGQCVWWHPGRKALRRRGEATGVTGANDFCCMLHEVMSLFQFSFQF